MGRNNFGWKSRQISKAGKFALNHFAQHRIISYSTMQSLGHRWVLFADWLKENGKVRWLEDLTRDHVIEYGQELAALVDANEMAPAYAQNLVSTINSVMELVTRGCWERVSPTKDCGISKRRTVRDVPPPAMDLVEFDRIMKSMRNSGMERQASIAELARHLGLRSKEASLLDVHKALLDARRQGSFAIKSGSKGGRGRLVPATTDRQIAVLKRAAMLQPADHRSLIPIELNWKEWREGPLRAGREVLQTAFDGCAGYKDLRAAYACERYKALTGFDAPVISRKSIDRALDQAARNTIAEELGHLNVSVVSAYVGGAYRDAP
jgi:hypothetical protein